MLDVDQYRASNAKLTRLIVTSLVANSTRGVLLPVKYVSGLYLLPRSHTRAINLVIITTCERCCPLRLASTKLFFELHHATLIKVKVDFLEIILD